MMQRTSVRAAFATAATFLAAFAFDAHAQATRTFISGVGDDTNPCSRAAPCRTFQGAIALTAAHGEINVLDPGGFGAVTITKSITITSETQAGILVAAQSGVTVNCASEPGCKVVLRNLDINGLEYPSPNGVNFLQGGELHLENVMIYGFDTGVNFQPSGGSYLFVKDSSIRMNAVSGVMIKPTGSGTANAVIDNTTLDRNGRGLRVEDRSVVTVRNSRAVGNTANGFVGYATAGGQLGLTIDNCIAQSNGAAGVYSGSGSTVYLANSLVTGNLNGLQTLNGGIISLGGNKVYGNAASNGLPTSSIPTL